MVFALLKRKKRVVKMVITRMWGPMRFKAFMVTGAQWTACTAYIHGHIASCATRNVMAGSSVKHWRRLRA